MLMHRYDIGVGDVVRVRAWDDMAGEYDVVDGDIFLPDYVFLAEMKCFCGVEYEVVDVGSDLTVCLRSLNTNECSPSDDYVITPYMLEPVYSDELASVEESDFISILMQNGGDR